ncbi:MULTISPECIES: Fe-S cluster assembly protein SufD [unclassified Ensifer]|uniref:Fe-S cluster assembly protein SufD n=1 Tax=unclassified Ensifer TaxID=2633371 RepID=UPI00070EB3EB|nr:MULTISPECIES: Fe-S cluster assembly protein SufD [unclassified Ensifer]KQW58970.1 ABC transporter ATP-binding protein [Ensifer sp. Root1252]KRC67806.1 ABC transporter ATP-binding protein [Ensifer sp. Root231]KRC98882.1 ABC transporter ATP-binding protein [Ensifer sp. Root258]
MNMQQAIKMTAAETALVDAYTAQIGDLPGDGSVLSVRDTLVHELRTSGLPTRRVESWHYTDLRTLLRAVPAADPTAFADRVEALVAGSTVLAVRNGHADLKGNAPEGVTMRSYTDSLLDGSAAAGLAVLGSDDAIGRINGGLVRGGIELAIADGTELEDPLEIQLVQSIGQSHTRFPVSFGANTKATVIERHLSTDAGESLVSTVSDVAVGEGADIIWIILQQQGAADTHLGQMRFDLAKDAKLYLFVINAGGKLVRQEIHGKTSGEGADFKLRGINLLGGESHTDVTFMLGHNVPHTTSTEIIRNVVFDRAKGVFQGKILVAKDAQKTDARMACNTLLLSDDADLSSKPELEIFADDVQCGHGATVTDIDHTQLFYLLARGIPENKARAMLVNAFVAEIVEELDDEPLVEALEGVISAWLVKHA